MSAIDQVNKHEVYSVRPVANFSGWKLREKKVNIIIHKAEGGGENAEVKQIFFLISTYDDSLKQRLGFDLILPPK